MESVMEALKQTPWWVYLLFVYFLLLGIKALKDSTISLKKLVILPIVFIYWSFNSLNQNGLLECSPVGKYLLFGIIGIIIGYFAYARVMEAYCQKSNLFHVRGSVQTLVIFMLIFAAKYTFGYLTASDPDILLNPDFRWVYLIIEGVVSGFYIGRLLNCLYIRWKGPFLDE